MKVRNIKDLKNGVSRESAEKIFDDIDKFAGYGFNKSHSFAYATIAYWCQYLKTHHAADYFAATLTIADDEDKLKAAVTAAKKSGISVLPPDINISSNSFEIGTDQDGNEVLYSSFSKLKGLSEKSANAILEARSKVGKFESAKHFESVVNKRSCNSRVRDALDKVGAFVSVEPEQADVWDESRVKDQIELLPGLIMKYVKPNRKTKVDDIATEIMQINTNVRNCTACELSGSCVMANASGSHVRYMVISDTPTKEEIKDGAMFMKSGKGRTTLIGTNSEAGPMTVADLNPSGGYFTSVVKNKGGEKSTPEQIALCKKHLDDEIKLVNPALIICLGGASIRYFYPEVKGGWQELCGQVRYNKELDATIVFGINPLMMYFREEAKKMLTDVFKVARKILMTK